MLSNDYKAVMSTIEQLMHELHAEVKKAGASAPDKATNRTSQPAASIAASNAAALPQLPFAVVDEVSTSSPAEEAGAMVGDQLISFAAITRQTPNTLQAVAAALQVYACADCTMLLTLLCPHWMMHSAVCYLVQVW